MLYICVEMHNFKIFFVALLLMEVVKGICGNVPQENF